MKPEGVFGPPDVPPVDEIGEPGRYPFVSHVMVDAERGAHGLFRVTR